MLKNSIYSNLLIFQFRGGVSKLRLEKKLHVNMKNKIFINTIFSNLVLSFFLACFISPTRAQNEFEGSEVPKVVLQKFDIKANTTITNIENIGVYFKLDPRLTRSLSMGERWVSPETFTSVLQVGKQATVQAKTVGLDRNERVMLKRLKAQWVATNPDLVKISATEGEEITITTLQPGESKLIVTANGVSRILTIKSDYRAHDDKTIIIITKGVSEKHKRIDVKL